MNLSYQILKERYIDLKKSHKTLLDEVLKLHLENKQLKKEISRSKEDCKNLMNIINNNCKELNTTKEEFESVKRWNK